MFKIKYVEKFWKWFWTITCVRIFKILKNKADWIRVRAFVAQVSDVASDPLVFMWLNTPFHTIVDNKIYHNITLSFKGLGINLSGGGGGTFDFVIFYIFPSFMKFILMARYCQNYIDFQFLFTIFYQIKMSLVV